MEQYDKLMQLFRRECQYAGAARWVLDATLQDLLDKDKLADNEKIITRLVSRIESLHAEYNP